MTDKARPVLVLILTSLAMTVITVNLTFVSVGLPAIARDLHASTTSLEWIVDSYALVFACLLLVAGYLGDRFGAKQVLLIGLAIFTVSTVIAATSTSAAELIGARCLMGLGAAGIMPMTLSLISHVYTDPDRLRSAIGTWAAIGSAAAIISPLVAGLILAHYSWSVLFWANAPLTALVFIAVLVGTPRFSGQRTGSFDAVGAIFWIIFAGTLVASLIEGPQRGWHDTAVLGGFVISVVGLVAFVAWERRRTDPLIDVNLFKIPRFSVGVTIVAAQYFFAFASGFATTLLLQLVLGNSALRAGVIGIPGAIAVTVFAPLGAKLFERFGGRLMITLAMLVFAMSAAALSQVQVTHTYPMLIFSMLTMSIGIGLIVAGTTTMVMSSVRPEHAGMASGAQSTTRQLGGAIGVALAGSLIATTYSAQLGKALSGTIGAPFLTQARVSLANALQLSGAPNSVRGLVSGAAKQSFVDGVHVAAVVLTVVALLMAVTTWIVLSPRYEGRNIYDAAPEHDLAEVKETAS